MTVMEITASEICAWARGEMNDLLRRGDYKSRRALHGRLAEISGLSISNIQTFHRDMHSPSAETLDRLVTAIKTEARLRKGNS